MNSQEIQPTPCPECGGPRALFRVAREEITIYASFNRTARLYAWTCLSCGATSLRPAPQYMESIREWAKTQKPFDLIE